LKKLVSLSLGYHFLTLRQVKLLLSTAKNRGPLKLEEGFMNWRILPQVAALPKNFQQPLVGQAEVLRRHMIQDFIRPSWRGAWKAELSLLWREKPLITAAVLFLLFGCGFIPFPYGESVALRLYSGGWILFCLVFAALRPFHMLYAISGDQILCCRGDAVHDKIWLQSVQEVLIEQDFMDELLGIYTVVFYLPNKEVAAYGLARMDAFALRELARFHMGSKIGYRF
jgi:hypothetical protein